MIGAEYFKRYAVFVPIVAHRGKDALLFEKRAASLRRQPGEICFPGGKLEPSESPEDCAVRETGEELLVDKGQITLCGPGDLFVSPFNLIIYPFIGRLDGYRGTFSPDEVDEIIAVPLDFLFSHEPEAYPCSIVNRLPSDFPYERIPGGEHYNWAVGNQDILFYQAGEHLIWGITAQIVRSVLPLIRDYHLV